MDEFRGKTLLVTGGTGSFGNFVVHRLLELGAKEVRVFSRDEKKQYDLRVFYDNRPQLTFVIGDIRDRRAVDEAMEGIDIVFQAAALKQVPTCECYPLEAVETNILGVQNLVSAALEHCVEAFVAISTDKAVKPVNVMGMTKALQERIVLRANLSRQNKSARFVCVRYGNVLRSRGSVVPFFRRQLALGQRLTVTDERMTRFLLTLNDAIDLVIYAALEGNGGEILVRKAPAAKLIEIAAVLAEEVSRPLDYTVIGVLPGEKINEILVSEEETSRTEDVGVYYRIHPWWNKAQPAGLTQEYSSGDHLVSKEEIRALVAKADAEFASMEVLGGEYYRF